MLPLDIVCIALFVIEGLLKRIILYSIRREEEHIQWMKFVIAPYAV